MTKLDLALEILRATARDANKECCADVSDDGVCVLRLEHKGEHRREHIDRVVPF